MTHINDFYDLDRSADYVKNRSHRDLVGGLWDEIGRLQCDYLKNHGLKPGHRLLDIGCGCLRGGVHFVDYLDVAHYYGIDISQDLLDAGYDVELGQLGLQHKLPRENLTTSEVFDASSFGVSFDAAIALSLFTHLPLNHIKLCLTRLADNIHAGGFFFATIFLSPDGHDWAEPLSHPGTSIVTYPANDPYHSTVDDISHCCSGLPWAMEIAGNWKHPHNQSMVIFRKTG